MSGFLLTLLWQWGWIMVGVYSGLGRCQDARLAGGDAAPGVTGASFTTPRSTFFRQPQSSRVNKQILFSLLISALWWKRENLPKSGWKEWLVNTNYILCLFIFFPSWELSTKKQPLGGQMAACLCSSGWLQGSESVFEHLFISNFFWVLSFSWSSSLQNGV